MYILLFLSCFFLVSCAGPLQQEQKSRRDQGIEIELGVKLNNLGIRLNIASAGSGRNFISKFHGFSYWIDGSKVISGSQIMVLEIWVNNRRLVRCFQNSASKLLFCEISSWPNSGKKQIVMADFCEEGLTIPSGSITEIYNFILDRFSVAADRLTRPGRIKNIIKKIRKYEELGFTDSINQFD